MKLKIEKLDNFGRGITYDDDKIVFVSNALPSEEVDIVITKSNKKYYEGFINKYYSESKYRCSSDCYKYVDCGGCSLRHMSYSLENEFKENKVKDILSKFGGIDKSVVQNICYSTMNNYRNKVVLHGKNGLLGLYREDTKEIIQIDSCLLLNNKINDIIAVLNSINKNILSVTIKTSNDLEHSLVSINGEIDDTQKLLEICDVLIINGNVLTKENSILTSVGDKKFYLSCESFFQINTTLTKDLYDKVYSYLKDSKSLNVLDLYCGTGTIGIYISDLCSSIVGVDYNRSNIDDANRNKVLNSINNISFICDKVENVIDSFSNIDVVIVDPPRSGLDKKTIKYLLKILAENIIYVSCDPVTLARDLKELSSYYDVVSVTPFNMFPRTYHVECVSFLKRKEN